MKRNDFITNVLKCNNFHCLASLRLVDLNLPFLSHLISGPGLASLRLVDLNSHVAFMIINDICLASLRLVDLNHIALKSLIMLNKSSLPEASGFKL